MRLRFADIRIGADWWLKELAAEYTLVLQAPR